MKGSSHIPGGSQRIALYNEDGHKAPFGNLGNDEELDAIIKCRCSQAFRHRFKAVAAHFEGGYRGALEKFVEVYAVNPELFHREHRIVRG